MRPGAPSSVLVPIHDRRMSLGMIKEFEGLDDQPDSPTASTTAASLKDRVFMGFLDAA